MLTMTGTEVLHQASVEQLSCLGLWWGGAAWIGEQKSTVGGSLNIIWLGGMFLISVIVLTSEGVLLLQSCIVRPFQGMDAGGFMMTQSGWEELSIKASCILREKRGERLVNICEWGEGGVVGWVRLASIISLE